MKFWMLTYRTDFPSIYFLIQPFFMIFSIYTQGFLGVSMTPSLQSRRILQHDPLFFFGNNVFLPSWTLILPESGGESITDFKGEVGLFLCFSRWRPRSMYVGVSAKKRLRCRLYDSKIISFSVRVELNIPRP